MCQMKLRVTALASSHVSMQMSSGQPSQAQPSGQSQQTMSHLQALLFRFTLFASALTILFMFTLAEEIWEAIKLCQYAQQISYQTSMLSFGIESIIFKF